jgi:hypothetical protein
MKVTQRHDAMLLLAIHRICITGAIGIDPHAHKCRKAWNAVRGKFLVVRARRRPFDTPGNDT